MFESILIATDGSQHGERAVEVGSELAGKFGSRVWVVHVLGHGELPAGLRQMAEIEHLVQEVRPVMLEPDPVPGGIPLSRAADSAAQAYRVWHAVGQTIVKQACSKASAKGITAEALTCEGDAGQAILDTADKVHADLIVMGRRGVSQLKGLVLGSVSQKVCQRSLVACLTVV